MNYTIAQLREYSQSIDLTKKGQKDRLSLYIRIIESMEKHGIKDLESRKDVANLGQLIESLIKAVKHGYESGFYSRCNVADLKDGNGAWEIKVSSSHNSLATPFNTPKRVMFVTPKGVAVLSKATISDLMETCESEYVKIDEKGIRLKINALELGKPVKWLNEVLGF
jgi:hypothetical protein